jgi:hypothetical protein
MNAKAKAALASYGRSFVVAAAAAYGLGQTDPKDILIAGLVAIIGPGLRAINKNDPAFGLIADEVTKLVKAQKKK